MFENKKINIIISFVVAITLWTYVIGETNPQDTKTFREIPITYINEQVLTDNDLAVVSVSDRTIAVTVSGSRGDVHEITEKDITATVNLADAVQGKNQLKVSVQVPDDVEFKDKSLSKVSVDVEQLESKQMEVVPDYKGTFAEEEEPITLDIDQKTVTITGAVSQVEKVQSVKAAVRQGSVTHDPKTFECSLTAVDRKGIKVENIDFSVDTVKVTAQLVKTKKVKLHVPVIDRNAAAIEKNISVPKNIVIKGKAEDLANIDTIETQSVDLSDITESATLNLVPILPEGVQVSSVSAGTLNMTVNVVETAQKNFNFTEADIDIEGLGEGFDAQIQTQKIKITAEGTKTLIEQLERGEISLAVNLDNLDAGNHQVDLIVKCSKKHIILNTDIDKINVTIEEK